MLPWASAAGRGASFGCKGGRTYGVPVGAVAITDVTLTSINPSGWSEDTVFGRVLFAI